MNKLIHRWGEGGLIVLSLMLLAPLACFTQITPSYVIGSYGGHSPVGAWLYSYHVGEVCVGTGGSGTMLATLGFLQPQELSVLAEAPQLELKGNWADERPQLIFALQTSHSPTQYEVWRGQTLAELVPRQVWPGQALTGTWIDPEAEEKTHWYYQLRAYLPDGQVVLSNPVLLRRSPGPANWQVFPNPASHQLHVKMTFSQMHVPLHLRLSNALGQAVWQKQRPVEAPQWETQVPVSQLAEGMYLLEAWTPQQRWRQWVRIGR
jgi:hypothetical protein